MDFTPEQLTLILTAAGGLLAAFGYFIRSFAKARLLDAEAQAKVAVIHAENEARELETDNSLIKSQTETLSDMRTELRVLRQEKRNLEAERDDYKLQWTNTQTMLEMRNEKVIDIEERLRKAGVEIENLRTKLEFCLDVKPDLSNLINLDDMGDTNPINDKG